MRKLETYHHTFSEAGTHTFELAVKPYELLVKNLTSSNISVSYGTAIDTENDSYMYMPKNTAEPIGAPFGDMDLPIKVTVQAEGTGMVELRIIEY